MTLEVERGEKFQVFAAEETEYGGGLALGGEAAALAGIRGVGHGCGLLGLDANDVATGCPTEPRSGGVRTIPYCGADRN
jgi:hypothetical protein